MDLGPAGAPLAENLNELPETTWIEPLPDPADAVIVREMVRLAFVAALQHLPPRQRAVVILCDVLRWSAGEVAELSDASVASVNSALQRARATLRKVRPELEGPADVDPDMLRRYVAAFEAYDFEALTSLIHKDAVQSMPPYDLWLRGRDDIFSWWVGPGAGCRGSRVVPATPANRSPAFGQYKPGPAGAYEPWALQVLEVSGHQIRELTFFLSTARLFPLFGLPMELEG